jgi:hypothetical protein
MHAMHLCTLPEKAQECAQVLLLYFVQYYSNNYASRKQNQNYIIIVTENFAEEIHFEGGDGVVVKELRNGMMMEKRP